MQAVYASETLCPLFYVVGAVDAMCISHAAVGAEIGLRPLASDKTTTATADVMRMKFFCHIL